MSWIFISSKQLQLKILTNSENRARLPMDFPSLPGYHLSQSFSLRRVSAAKPTRATTCSPPWPVTSSRAKPWRTFKVGQGESPVQNLPFYPVLMWVKQCHKPPMTGLMVYSTHKDGDDWGMVCCFAHIIWHYEWFLVGPGCRASNRRGSCSLSRNCDKETIHTWAWRVIGVFGLHRLQLRKNVWLWFW